MTEAIMNVKDLREHLARKHKIDLRTLTEREQAIFEIGCCFQAEAQQQLEDLIKKGESNER
jgi:hypothetical protein